ncbi:Myb-like DNA-binding domain containing protein isoform 1 [Galdieria sulphuraria]|uniref:Myb-like DNA-binding domain containing protein isoform 1 n=2 Tax=Galdieria sulphuraria TaxID=130081 RepID=M2Y346_GALSU|nr:Myb-like DNA-binding domain containing protein isoform 1 [Galdieria sulphuraria]EME30244.1 Myb-like DNA-binding domain containing protein isoform 1 [Galdieria sulphuraria]|eukprot:XP_005706764.1 Myb-like DNA-binding domain containing protein isoform 1 [Galdieria sulphuraria]
MFWSLTTTLRGYIRQPLSNYRFLRSSSYLGTAKKGAPWTPEEDQKLLELLRSLKGVRKWTTLEDYFPERTHLAIRSRARTLVGSRSVSRAPFSQEEDERLLELVETHGEDFLTVGSFMEKRSPYQCSRRWFLHLKKMNEKAKSISIRPARQWRQLYDNFISSTTNKSNSN